MTDTKSLIGQVNKVPSRIWDVYKKPDVRVDIEDYTYVFNAVEGREDLSTQDDFEISNQDLGVYINPSDSWLELRLVIADAAKDGVKIDENIAIQNDVMNLFSRAELELDDLKVEEVKEPGIVINALGLMMQSPDHEEISSLWGWAKDGIITEIEDKSVQFGATAAGGYGAFVTNKGWLRRAGEHRNGRQKTYWVPLRRIFPFFNNNRMVLRGQNIKVLLTKNPEANIFHTRPDATDAFINYKRVGIHWATIKPDPSTSLILEKKLASNQKQSLLWNAVTLHKTKDFVSQGDIEYDFNIQKGVPQRLIILPYLSAQFGARENNNVQWPNLNLETLQVKLNSKNYPQKQLKISLDDTKLGSINTGEAYHFFADAGGMIYDRGGGNLISEREWSERYRIYVINFEKPESVYDPKRNWEIQVEISLTAPAQAAPFRFFNIVQSTRKATLQGLQGKLNFEN